MARALARNSKLIHEEGCILAPESKLSAAPLMAQIMTSRSSENPHQGSLGSGALKAGSGAEAS
jgi:hypothetical protein